MALVCSSRAESIAGISQKTSHQCETSFDWLVDFDWVDLTEWANGII